MSLEKCREVLLSLYNELYDYADNIDSTLEIVTFDGNVLQCYVRNTERVKECMPSAQCVSLWNYECIGNLDSLHLDSIRARQALLGPIEVLPTLFDEAYPLVRAIAMLRLKRGF